MIFQIRLTPLPGVDAIKALRRVLKALRRQYGMRCISAVQEDPRILAPKQEPAPDGSSGTLKDNANE